MRINFIVIVLFYYFIMTATVLAPTKTAPFKSTWQLKDRRVQIVGSHSGQVDWWYLKIQWSDKLGLTYYKAFTGDAHDPKIYAEAKKVAEYIMQKGFIRPDATIRLPGKDYDTPVWEKDFYPHRDFLRTSAD
tara:strand:+ start:119 stop:514 length:396 start_codon:yes stop_codon:yes gene_type:complete